MKVESSPTFWNTPSVALVCVVFVALGFLLGRRTFHPRSPSPNSAATAVAAAAPRVFTAPTANSESRERAPELRAWEARWDELLKQRSTPARNAQLCALLEELGQTDPERALALARSFADWRLRDLCRNAAVRGWARVAPDAAADWALATRTDERCAVVEAVMQGAAHQPSEAVRVALRLCATDPERGGDYGHFAIGALVDRGAFDSALRFGLEVGPDKYPFLVKSALFQWGRNQPAAALAAVENITDPIVRGQARGEALAGWAWADAKSLAEHARSLPPGGERAQILAEALPRWVEKDPAAAAEWINRFGEDAEADTGIAAMANLQSIITQQPALAMQLAGGISAPAERTHTMRAVIRQWAQNDLAGAQQFIGGLANAADRAALQSELQDLVPTP